MNTPNPHLMRAYGTNDVFEKKAENVLPLAARIAVGLLNYKTTERDLEQARMQQLEAQVLNAMMAQAEKDRHHETEDRLRYTPPRALIAARRGTGGIDPDQIPVGMDMGMVRLASIAEEAGRQMAKESGIMARMAKGVEGSLAQRGAQAAVKAAPKASKPLLDWQGKLLGGGLLAAGSYGALQGAKKGLGWLGEEPHPANYNQGGYQVPSGVNQYGYPEGTLY